MKNRGKVEGETVEWEGKFHDSKNRKPEFTAAIQRRAGNGRFKETGGFAEGLRGVPTCPLHVTTPLPFTEPTQSPFRPVPSRSVSAIKATAL